MKKTALVFLIGFALLALPVHAQINLLHEFVGAITDGAYPNGDLIISGTILYGMTYWGGKNDNGTIFKIQVDGSGYELLHEFSRGADDGAVPEGSLTLYGSTLFGMTSEGGDGDDGTLFKIETDGSGFTLLHEFVNSDVNDGFRPLGSLTLSGTTLFGMTSGGGRGENGTIFKIEIDGSGYDLLHEFTGNVDDGAYPCGTLIISGSTLYGTTAYGGEHFSGTIFKIETDGSGFTLLHEFVGATADGEYPQEALLLSGSTLFGMTSQGGSNRKGTLFKVNTDGSGYLVLHEFTGSNDDGEAPQGALIISGSTLYGTTWNGGDYGTGTIFKIQADGTGFSLLYDFINSSTEGSQPSGSLLFYNLKFFGMTEYGGVNNTGVIFSLPINSISGTVTHDGSPLAKVVMDGLPGNPVTDGSGQYSSIVAAGWSGTVTPTRQNFTFTPGYTNYSNIDSDQVTDYTSTLSEPLFVTSPNGGENWPLGSSQKIAWDYNSLSGNVRLVLYRNNVKVGVIATVPVTQGCFTWMAGAYNGGTAVAAKNYRIKAVTTDGMYGDWSDASFTLNLDPYVRVATPNGGESWVKGGIQAINWNCRGVSGNVRLVLYSGNTKVGVIATVAASLKNYNWTVGDHSGGSAAAGSNYRIKVVTIDGMHADYSDEPFSIRAI